MVMFELTRQLSFTPGNISKEKYSNIFQEVKNSKPEDIPGLREFQAPAYTRSQEIVELKIFHDTRG
jgi:hypothetical protein